MPTQSLDPSSSALSVYAFDNARSDAPAQMRLLADILDPHTIRVLEGIGVSQGWRCLDVGAGAGSIASWLAGRVGPTGQVTALDLDPRHVPVRPGVEIRAGDVRTAPLPHNLDLIHARLVLAHLAERRAVLARLVAALRPDGLLVISDWEPGRGEQMLVSLPSREASEAFLDFHRAMCRTLMDAGYEPAWAQRAAVAMREAGLCDLHATVYNRLWAGGSPGCVHLALNTHQLEDRLVAHGVTAGQLQVLRAALEDPQALVYSYPMITTVGRKPV